MEEFDNNMICSTNEDDDYHVGHTFLSAEELNLRINKFSYLCLKNKLNITNAFDIDMIGYFYTWLEKKTQGFNDNTFKEIADYLEASGQIYSYRIDKLRELTGKLVEEFKNVHCNILIESDDENTEELNHQKPKKQQRQRIMLSTPEKLRSDSFETNHIFDPTIKEEIFKFNFNEIFEISCPSKYLTSLYFNNSIDKVENFFDEMENSEKSPYELCDFENLLNDNEICSDYCDFIADHDKFEDTEMLDCVENGFDMNDHQFQNINTDSNQSNNCINQEIDTDMNEKNETVIDQLVECVGNNNSDYSFFKPKALANWNGPKAWKYRTMAKSLKSFNSNEQIMPDDIDDINQNDEFIKNKSMKNKFQVNWLNVEECELYLKDKVQSKEIVLPRIQLKWDSLDNICDLNCVMAEVKYKLSNLEYVELKPEDILHKEKINNKDESLENLNILSENEQLNECDENFEIAYLDLMSREPIEQNDELSDNELDNDSDDDPNTCLTNGCKLDITTLKKEIMEIIDSECIDLKSNSEFSGLLPFSKLLLKLRVLEREELGIPTVYVGLLHLANEQGLKLIQETYTLNNEMEFYISKPIIKN